MRALLQRVSAASVATDGETIGEIGLGLLVLLCAVKGDGEAETEYLARKIAALRLFADDAGKTNLSIRDVGGAALVVSQFTLAADWKKGNRPGFSNAAPPEKAEALYRHFCAHLKAEDVPVETGRFAASMQISLINDGPFTIWMDTMEG